MRRIVRTTALLVLDVLESIGLAACLLIAGPFLLIRGLNRLDTGWRLMRHLLPSGFLAPILRAELDHKLGRHEQAAAVYSHVIALLERPAVKIDGRLVDESLASLIEVLYRRMISLYFAAGQIDEAAIGVIRANKHLGVDRLPGLSEFDLRTAHIVKAGIAAGRLLDEGGLSTLLGKQTDGRPLKGAVSAKSTTTERTGVQAPEAPVVGAKVIPFPSPL